MLDVVLHKEVLSAWQRRTGLCPWRRPVNSQGPRPR